MFNMSSISAKNYKIRLKFHKSRPYINLTSSKWKCAVFRGFESLTCLRVDVTTTRRPTPRGDDAILFICVRQKCTGVMTLTGGNCRCRNDPGVAKGHDAGRLVMQRLQSVTSSRQRDSLSQLRYLVRDKTSSVLHCHLSLFWHIACFSSDSKTSIKMKKNFYYYHSNLKYVVSLCRWCIGLSYYVPAWHSEL